MTGAHPLTDVGGQSPFTPYAAGSCWADVPRNPYGCNSKVPLTDSLGLCSQHRLEILEPVAHPSADLVVMLT